MDGTVVAYGDYLFRRKNGIFYFRYAAASRKWGCKELRFSLRTRGYKRARHLASICYAQIIHMADFDDRSRFNDELENNLDDLRRMFLSQADPNDEKTISSINEAFNKLHDKTQWTKDNPPQEFDGKSPGEKTICTESLTPSFIKQNSSPDKTSSQLSCLSITTINKYIQELGSLFGWAKRQGYCSENIAEGLTIKQKKSAKDDRHTTTRLDDVIDGQSGAFFQSA